MMSHALFQGDLAANPTKVQQFLAACDTEALKALARSVGDEYVRRDQAAIKSELDALRERARNRLPRGGSDVGVARAAPRLRAFAAEDDNLDDDEIKTNVENCLRDGEDIDGVGDDRATALWLAARHGNAKLLRALIAKGADVDEQATARGAAPKTQPAARNDEFFTLVYSTTESVA